MGEGEGKVSQEGQREGDVGEYGGRDINKLKEKLPTKSELKNTLIERILYILIFCPQEFK